MPSTYSKKSIFIVSFLAKILMVRQPRMTAEPRSQVSSRGLRQSNSKFSPCAPESGCGRWDRQLNPTAGLKLAKGVNHQ